MKENVCKDEKHFSNHETDLTDLTPPYHGKKPHNKVCYLEKGSVNIMLKLTHDVGHGDGEVCGKITS